MRKILSIIGTFLLVKVLFWVRPDSKIVLKRILIGLISIILIFYFHKEYLNWSKTTNFNKFDSFSFIIKNIVLALTVLITFVSIRKNKNKYDGFDKFRDTNIKTSNEKLYGESSSREQKIIDDKYFDKFRDKKKLRTSKEIKLEKKSKE
jgi:predicted membrane protein